MATTYQIAKGWTQMLTNNLASQDFVRQSKLAHRRVAYRMIEDVARPKSAAPHPSFKNAPWVVLHIHSQMNVGKEWVQERLREALDAEDQRLQEAVLQWHQENESTVLESWIAQNHGSPIFDSRPCGENRWIDWLPTEYHRTYCEIFETAYMKWRKNQLTGAEAEALRKLDEIVQRDGNRRVRLVQECMVLCQRMYEDFESQVQEPYTPNLYHSMDTDAASLGVKARTRQGRLHLWNAAQQDAILRAWWEQEHLKTVEELLQCGAAHRDAVVQFMNQQNRMLLDSPLPNLRPNLSANSSAKDQAVA